MALPIYVTTEKQAVLKKKSKEKDYLSEISLAVHIWRFPFATTANSEFIFVITAATVNYIKIHFTITMVALVRRMHL